MSTRLTPAQYRTLTCIIDVGGKTMLLPAWWRDRHHQALIRRGFLHLRADPFKTKANMLRGRITAAGRRAAASASDAVRAQAKADADRDYRKYVAALEGGEA